MSDETAARLGDAELAARKGPEPIDGIAGAAVARSFRLEHAQHALRAVRSPHCDDPPVSFAQCLRRSHTAIFAYDDEEGETMLIFSMSASVDGFIADREGGFEWGVPSDEQFRFHLEHVRELGRFLCGRRLYETMLVWETDPSVRDDELRDAFADAWCALPKVVFSRTLDSVQGNARLAEASVAEEAAAALAATDKDVAIGGAGLAAEAIELGLVDELRIFRNPILVGGGTPLLPPVTEDVPLELIETRTFGSRVVYERYGRARAVSR
jgi:dihydrofolate reductase